MKEGGPEVGGEGGCEGKKNVGEVGEREGETVEGGSPMTRLDRCNLPLFREGERLQRGVKVQEVPQKKGILKDNGDASCCWTLCNPASQGYNRN